jgi:two-component system phosphate regulon sensor histidine kinase PhoR
MSEQQSEMLTNLLSVSSYLTSVLDPEELFTNLTKHIVDALPTVQAGLLWLYDRQNHSLSVVSISGSIFDDHHELINRLRLRPGLGLAGVTLQSNEIQLVEGRGRYREMTGRTNQNSHADLRQFLEILPRDLTAVLLPLRTGAHTIGVLELLNIGGAPFPHQADLQLLQTFTNLIAGAIKNAQLHAQMQIQQHRLEALGAISTVVSTAADLNELMSNVLDVTLNVVNSKSGALMLLNPSRSALTLGAYRNLPKAFVEHQSNILVSEAPCEEAVRYGQPIRRPLIAERGEEILLEANLSSCIYLPLLAGGTVAGVISIYGNSSLYERADIPSLMTMGNSIGFAIANVELYEDSQIERRKLLTIIDSIAEGVMLYDRQGGLIMLNEMARSLLLLEQVPYQQALNEMPEFYSMRDLEGNVLPIDRSPTARALAGEVFHDYRLLLRGVSGQDSVMSFSGAPVHDVQGMIEGAVVVFRDITNSQKLERAKDDFLAVAAHELRSPLAAVRGYTDLLVRREQRRGDEDSSELRGLTILAQQVTHMLRMVDNLLDVSRLDAGQFNLTYQRVNLISLIEQVLEQQRPNNNNHDLELESSHRDLFATCDPLRVRQVLTNLISNAIRYSPQYTRISVGITYEWASQLARHHPSSNMNSGITEEQIKRNSKMALIWIQDQGAGITEEHIERLFKRYSRGQERRGEGLGLGLYLSCEFIIRHNGAIWVESIPQQGSIFYIALPLEPLNHSEESYATFS